MGWLADCPLLETMLRSGRHCLETEMAIVPDVSELRGTLASMEDRYLKNPSIRLSTVVCVPDLPTIFWKSETFS
jgi:hypothetical protein